MSESAAPPVLVEVVRGSKVESRHRGQLVLLGDTGARTTGDVDAEVFPRSALKPLQAVAMLDNGFAGRGPSLAIAVASHDGEPMHIDAVADSLATSGLEESALRCPPALPATEPAMIAWLRSGRAQAPICHNCSGKHAAMLGTCVANGWDREAYLDPGHPLQLAACEHIASLSGVPVTSTLVDGCGAPAFAITLRGLARSFATLATATSGPNAMVAAAMRRHPELIGGTTNAASLAMRGVPGLICKNGAEGVWAAALPDGRAFAAKLEDGSARALPALLAAVLGYWGAPPQALRPWGEVEVLGGGSVVGALRPSSELMTLLGEADPPASG